VASEIGRADEARKLLDQLKQESARRYVQGYAFAIIYIGLSEKEEALNWLEKEISDRSSTTIFYGISPDLDELAPSRVSGQCSNA
jgi:hypothetical protein